MWSHKLRSLSSQRFLRLLTHVLLLLLYTTLATSNIISFPNLHLGYFDHHDVLSPTKCILDNYNTCDVWCTIKASSNTVMSYCLLVFSWCRSTDDVLLLVRFCNSHFVILLSESSSKLKFQLSVIMVLDLVIAALSAGSVSWKVRCILWLSQYIRSIEIPAEADVTSRSSGKYHN